jgi:hypothetical protein
MSWLFEGIQFLHGGQKRYPQESRRFSDLPDGGWWGPTQERIRPDPHPSSLASNPSTFPTNPRASRLFT